MQERTLCRPPRKQHVILSGAKNLNAATGTQALRQPQSPVRSNAGFTLMEMLIVVAIIAALVAIAIPSLLDSIDSAKRRTDVASIQAGYAAACSEYMLNPDGTRTLYLQRNGMVSTATADTYKTQGKASASDGVAIGADANVTWSEGLTVSYGRQNGIVHVFVNDTGGSTNTSGGTSGGGTSGGSGAGGTTNPGGGGTETPVTPVTPVTPDPETPVTPTTPNWQIAEQSDAAVPDGTGNSSVAALNSATLSWSSANPISYSVKKLRYNDTIDENGARSNSGEARGYLLVINGSEYYFEPGYSGSSGDGTVSVFVKLTNGESMQLGHIRVTAEEESTLSLAVPPAEVQTGALLFN